MMTGFLGDRLCVQEPEAHSVMQARSWASIFLGPGMPHGLTGGLLGQGALG